MYGKKLYICATFPIGQKQRLQRNPLFNNVQPDRVKMEQPLSKQHAGEANTNGIFSITGPKCQTV